MIVGKNRAQERHWILTILGRVLDGNILRLAELTGRGGLATDSVRADDDIRDRAPRVAADVHDLEPGDVRRGVRCGHAVLAARDDEGACVPRECGVPGRGEVPLRGHALACRRVRHEVVLGENVGRVQDVLGLDEFLD